MPSRMLSTFVNCGNALARDVYVFDTNIIDYVVSGQSRLKDKRFVVVVTIICLTREQQATMIGRV